MKREKLRRYEELDSRPVEMPIGFNRPPTLQEQIRRLIRTEMSMQAASQGQESWEEADDFNVGDDYDPTSPYELNFDHDANIDSLKAIIRENKKRLKEMQSASRGDRARGDTPQESVKEKAPQDKKKSSGSPALESGQ